VTELVAEGMDVARVNLSHASPDVQTRTFAAVRSASEEVGRPVGILADLPGPKVRLGKLRRGQARPESGEPFVLRCDDPSPGDESGASVSYPGLCRDLRPGDRVMLSDGAVTLQVLGVRGSDVECVVVRGGRVRSRGGVNIPSERLSLPAVTDADRDGVARALSGGADFIAQSFVRKADDVRTIRELIWDRSVSLVAKIETRSAVDDFDAICREADAVMIARGDLGVDIPFEEVPVLQKELVQRALELGVPCIVATQMLESMTGAPRPTRAEASDVANAVLDSADAILLSAETAIGDYPVESARAASRIVEAAERAGSHLVRRDRPPGAESDAHEVARAVDALLAPPVRTSAVACFTRTGRTASLLSQIRPTVPVFAFAPDPAVVRQLTMRRAIIPLVSEMPADTDSMLQMMDARVRATGAVQPGDVVLMVAATPVGRAHTNLLKVHRIGPEEG